MNSLGGVGSLAVAFDPALPASFGGPYNWVDLGVLVLLILVGLIGWRAGLIATAAAFFGFVGGALFGAWLVPQLTAGRDLPVVLNTVLLLIGLVLGGVLGQALLGWLGSKLRTALDFAPVRFVDSLAGSLASGMAFLLTAWLALSLIAALPGATPVQLVRDSRSYAALESMMSGPAGSAIEELRGLLAQLDLPRIPFNEALLPPVAEPDSAAVSRARQVASESVLPVTALAGRCPDSATGSAVVISSQRVVTNAHVVAGASQITVRPPGSAPLPARVVYLDRGNDVAVLLVAGLAAPAPKWADARRGTAAAVTGYPLGGPLKVRPARVRGSATVPLEGGSGGREVLVFRGRVQPGNSGGALLDEEGSAIGLVFASAENDENTGFALPAALVTQVTSKTRESTKEVSTGACAKN
ncbi:MAG: MarP family serine protease [Candidatus Nanopelagicales bacterium]